jgi:hypothetical protein
MRFALETRATRGPIHADPRAVFSCGREREVRSCRPQYVNSSEQRGVAAIANRSEISRLARGFEFQAFRE